eukprot:g4181.t1
MVSNWQEVPGILARQTNEDGGGNTTNKWMFHSNAAGEANNLEPFFQKPSMVKPIPENGAFTAGFSRGQREKVEQILR